MAKKRAPRASKAAPAAPPAAGGPFFGPAPGVFIWVNPGIFMRFITGGSPFIVDGQVQYGRLPLGRKPDGGIEWNLRAQQVRVRLVWKQIITEPMSPTQVTFEALGDITYPENSTDGHFAVTMTANMINEQVGGSGPFLPNYYIDVAAEFAGQVVSYVWHTVRLVQSGIVVPPIFP